MGRIVTDVPVEAYLKVTGFHEVVDPGLDVLGIEGVGPACSVAQEMADIQPTGLAAVAYQVRGPRELVKRPIPVLVQMVRIGPCRRARPGAGCSCARCARTPATRAATPTACRHRGGRNGSGSRWRRCNGGSSPARSFPHSVNHGLGGEGSGGRKPAFSAGIRSTAGRLRRAPTMVRPAFPSGRRRRIACSRPRGPRRPCPGAVPYLIFTSRRYLSAPPCKGTWMPSMTITSFVRFWKAGCSALNSSKFSNTALIDS